MRKNERKTGPLFGIAILAGMIVSTSSAQPANAQIADILKNALVGQLAGTNYNDPYGYGSGYSDSGFGSYGNSLSNSGSGFSGILNQLLPGQNSSNLSANQDYLYNTPNAGNSLLGSLLPLVQNRGLGSNLLGSLPQSQLSSAYGSNCPTNLPGGSWNALSGYQNFGGVQPVVFNGVTLDSGIFTGPYRGTPHQVESAMNLDWQMTVLRQQISLGTAQGNLMPSDAYSFNTELSSLIDQKKRAVRRSGLSFADSQVLVSRLNDLVGRVRQAWYNQIAFNNDRNGNGWSRRARTSAYGRVLNQNKNEVLERLYLMTKPAGFRR